MINPNFLEISFYTSKSTNQNKLNRIPTSYMQALLVRLYNVTFSPCLLRAFDTYCYTYHMSYISFSGVLSTIINVFC